MATRRGRINSRSGSKRRGIRGRGILAGAAVGAVLGSSSGRSLLKRVYRRGRRLVRRTVVMNRLGSKAKKTLSRLHSMNFYKQHKPEFAKIRSLRLFGKHRKNKYRLILRKGSGSGLVTLPKTSAAISRRKRGGGFGYRKLRNKRPIKSGYRTKSSYTAVKSTAKKYTPRRRFRKTR